MAKLWDIARRGRKVSDLLCDLSEAGCSELQGSGCSGLQMVAPQWFGLNAHRDPRARETGQPSRLVM